MITFLNILFGFGILQGFVFVVYWLLVKKNKYLPVVYLNLFVLFLTLNNIQVLLFINEVFYENSLVKNIEFSWYLLILPYFLAFITHYFEIEKQEQSFLKIAWILFISQLLIRLLIILSINSKILHLDFILYYTKTEEVVNLLISLFLFYKVFMYVFKDQYSEKIVEYDTINWLRYLLIACCIIILFWIYAVFSNLFETENTKYMYNPLRISTAILLYWIAYVGMIKMNITFERIKYSKEKEQKDFESNETNINFHEDFEKIEKYITDNKRFTDPNFSLERLSVELNLSRSYLSKQINKNFGSFTDYLNYKKIEQSKIFLLEDMDTKYTLEVLAYECGFKSKSNFFLWFKKQNNCTPLEWKRKHK
jgi:AraC-like DNA-binding protein